MKINTIIHGDCLEVMKDIEDKSIDMILCDLPYGTTACKWDTIIPFEPLWEQYERIIKDGCAIVLFGSEPFSTYLRMSNIKNYKYDWKWNKVNAGCFVTAKYRPMSIFEDICVFSKNGGKIKYYPIMTVAEEKNKRPRNKGQIRNNDSSQSISSGIFKSSENHNENLRFPKNELVYNNRKKELNGLNRIHPTQKPVDLCEYLIKTYTNENDIVLDNCARSGTTGVACQNLKRNFILIEKEAKYCEVIKERIKI